MSDHHHHINISDHYLIHQSDHLIHESDHRIQESDHHHITREWVISSGRLTFGGEKVEFSELDYGSNTSDNSM